MNALVRDPLLWTDVGAVTDVPVRGARRVPTPSGDVAIFRTGDGRVFALKDACPHKGGPLSQGIVHGADVEPGIQHRVHSAASGMRRSASGANSCPSPPRTRSSHGSLW